MAMGWIGNFFMTTIDEMFKKSLFFEKKIWKFFVMSEKSCIFVV